MRSRRRAARLAVSESAAITAGQPDENSRSQPGLRASVTPARTAAMLRAPDWGTLPCIAHNPYTQPGPVATSNPNRRARPGWRSWDRRWHSRQHRGRRLRAARAYLERQAAPPQAHPGSGWLRSQWRIDGEGYAAWAYAP